MNKIITILSLAILAVGCVDNDPNPGPNPGNVFENYYIYQGDTIELKWAGFVDYRELLFEERGIEFFISTEELLENSLENTQSLNELIRVNVQPDMIGKTINFSDISGNYGFRFINNTKGIDYTYTSEGGDDGNPADDDETTGGKTDETGETTNPDLSITGRMNIAWDGEALSVFINITFDDGTAFYLRYSDDDVELLEAQTGMGRVTGLDGTTKDVSSAMFILDEYMTGSYRIDIMTMNEDLLPLHNLSFSIPVQLLGQTISLAERGSPTDRVQWSFTYTDNQSGASYAGYESIPYNGGDKVESGYMTLTIDPLKESFTLDFEAILQEQIGTISCNYTGTTKLPEEVLP